MALALEDLQEDVTPERVAELHAAGKIDLIDVRESYEREAGRIAATRHVQFAQLSDQAETVDRERPVVFYCRSGGRSAVATQAFRASGYDAHNMTGGLLAWVEQGLPIEPEDGSVAEH
ncbi:MAG: rhodanese-like domain-containing protein [Thermoleophilaceae bacterium]|nr:rhodanese-like domain-containing protein [Thermoleophilaceae bacterium]